jgi:hypothetical protein
VNNATQSFTANTAAIILFQTASSNAVTGLTYSAGTFTVTQLGVYIIVVSTKWGSGSAGATADFYINCNQTKYSTTAMRSSTSIATAAASYNTYTVVLEFDAFDNGTNATFAATAISTVTNSMVAAAASIKISFIT